jgi:hypothetical protein
MIVQLLAWGTVALGAAAGAVVSYAVTVTWRHPTAWANRIVAPDVPEDEFIVHGDDLVGLY